jgi:DNA repair protein RecN (Recombination protein N)
MIREIRIRNLALIDDLAQGLEEGFTVFTGETGAGKSILVGAIGLLLGDRASSESVRSGFDEAQVTGTFELPGLGPRLRHLLDDNDIPMDDDGLIVRRTISRTGRNRIHINQIPVPLATLKAIGDHLVDLHGQHEHQSLLRPETARHIIDSLAGEGAARADYDCAYRAYVDAARALEEHDRSTAALAERRDLLEFQYRELTAQNLSADTEERLEQEFALLSSVTDRMESVSRITALIEGSGGADALEHALAQIRRHLTVLEKHDPRAAPWQQQIEDVATALAELGTFCATYLADAGGTADPDRLDQINARLARIQRLKKKHRCDFAGLLERQRSLEAELASADNAAADRTELARAAATARRTAEEAAGGLSTARSEAACAFDKRISAQMAKLGFTDGKWRTVSTPTTELTPHGLEELAFEVRTNPGEPFLPLIKTASGGEISRLMLAVKTVLAARDRIPVLIFDEIDTGVGGLLAKAIAAALRELSRSHQVLCISHLHQIASAADHHVSVYKTTEEGRTVTRTRTLAHDEKITEIARMLGDESAISRTHARELLEGKRSKDR